jgi:hypothetical protein
MSEVHRIARELAARREADALSARADEWLRDEAVPEHDLAWLFGFCHERGFAKVLVMAPRFAARFPKSLYPVGVFFADLLARNGLFDAASDEARAYLRRTRDTGLLDDLAGKQLVADGVGRAFLLLTAAYTEVGARSYSRDVLAYALRHALADNWKAALRAEDERLAKELHDPALAAKDAKWRAFFADGGGYQALHAQCVADNFEALAHRLELLDVRFRVAPTARVDEDEILQVVQRDDTGKHLLA